jgi:hypothetical protein
MGTAGLAPQDRQEIQDLLIRYTYCLDELLSREEFYALFTEDAVLVSPFSGRYVGREGLEAFADHRASQSGIGQMRHIVCNFRIEGAGDVGRVTAYLLDWTTRPGDGPRKTEFLLAGHYECDVVRVNGQWKLKTRVLVVDGVSGGPDDKSSLNHLDAKVAG